MHIISIKRVRDFWTDPKHPATETALRWWYQQVRQALWESAADVKATFNSVDFVGRKVVFDVGGNKCRIIAVIDFEGHKVFIRHVLDHKEYDKGNWKKDTFGDDWKKREPGAPTRRRRRRKRR